MRKSLWVLAGIGVGGMVALTAMSRSLVTQVAGVEEAAELQAMLGSAYSSILAPEPPLRVMRVPGSEAWPGWRWKVEATLREKYRAGSPEVARSVPRIVGRALGTTVGGREASGVILLLHAAGAPDTEVLFDGAGRPAKGAR